MNKELILDLIEAFKKKAEQTLAERDSLYRRGYGDGINDLADAIEGLLND